MSETHGGKREPWDIYQMPQRDFMSGKAWTIERWGGGQEESGHGQRKAFKAASPELFRNLP